MKKSGRFSTPTSMNIVNARMYNDSQSLLKYNKIISQSYDVHIINVYFFQEF
jgi:hypothetical protein